MKAFYLTGAIIFSIIILVVAFENGIASCNLSFFGINMRQGTTFAFLMISFVGALTGVFATLFFSSLLNSNDEEDDDEL